MFALTITKHFSIEQTEVDRIMLTQVSTITAWRIVCTVLLDNVAICVMSRL